MNNLITKEAITNCGNYQKVFYLIDGKLESYLDENDYLLEELPTDLKNYVNIIPAVKYILNGGFSSYYYHCEEEDFPLAIIGFQNLGLTKVSQILEKGHKYFLQTKLSNPELSKDDISQKHMNYTNDLINSLESEYFSIITYEFIEEYIGKYFAKLYNFNEKKT